MTQFLLTSITGWFAAVLVVGTIALPYLVRRGLGGGRPSLSGAYDDRMKAHYWIGFAILALACLHLAISLVTGMAIRADGWGIAMAAAALLLVVAQVLLGVKLRQSSRLRRRIRAFHLSTMLLVVLLTGLHVRLNSPLWSQFAAQ